MTSLGVCPTEDLVPVLHGLLQVERVVERLSERGHERGAREVDLGHLLKVLRELLQDIVLRPDELVEPLLRLHRVHEPPGQVEAESGPELLDDPHELAVPVDGGRVVREEGLGPHLEKLPLGRQSRLERIAHPVPDLFGLPVPFLESGTGRVDLRLARLRSRSLGDVRRPRVIALLLLLAESVQEIGDGLSGLPGVPGPEVQALLDRIADRFGRAGSLRAGVGRRRVL